MGLLGGKGGGGMALVQPRVRVRLRRGREACASSERSMTPFLYFLHIIHTLYAHICASMQWRINTFMRTPTNVHGCIR